METFLNGISEKTAVLLKSKSRKAGKWLYSLFRLAFLISVGFVVIYPLFYMIVTSLESNTAFLNSTRVWIPNELDIVNNYKMAMECLSFGKAIISTLKNQIVAALLQVVSCSVVAYGFARFEFKGKKIKTALLFLTIILPDMMLLIPRMVNYSKLDFLGILGLFNNLTGIDLRIDIINSVWTFWIPALFGVGLKSGILIYIYIQFFKGLPRELEEAAWVDGSGPIRTFISIALPSSGVVIITVVLFSLIWHWNDFTLSSMYLSDNFPLAVMLNNFEFAMNNHSYYFVPRQPESMAFVMAACVLFVTPMLIVYMILQRWFIESIDRIGITG
ncbi:MAG: carbohydrate ABC transporter permease [Clostridia bacterium]|nr:carbohydrate ABC transporter permease [Clostridia bacterium]